MLLKNSVQWKKTTPLTSDEVLFNPGMGLYLHFSSFDADANEWFMKILNIVYFCT
ncbi:MAG: hypothetical protein GY874_03180 [Desulfobacteraceae bacterium]|nr:hypothetical protein [Desulfobacteraceae bacterium]